MFFTENPGSLDIPDVASSADATSGTSVVGSPPVLVVDDEPAGAAATEATLAAGGHSVAAESVGDAVLRLVRASLVRLVVSELYIPCSEGPCVVAALKSDRMRLPRLRVLVHSRHTAPANFARALDVGADAVVPKSARDEVLLREVARLLNGVSAA